MKLGKRYDLNLASRQYRMTRIWKTSPNIAKSFDEQFGKQYDANFVGYTDKSYARGNNCQDCSHDGVGG